MKLNFWFIFYVIITTLALLLTLVIGVIVEAKAMMSSNKGHKEDPNEELLF